MLCSVYKSEKMEFAYLYVARGFELKELPEALLNSFGEYEKVMDFDLKPDRVLAIASAADVLDSIKTQGFYLQMPPRNDSPLKQFLKF